MKTNPYKGHMKTKTAIQRATGKERDRLYSRTLTAIEAASDILTRPNQLGVGHLTAIQSKAKELVNEVKRQTAQAKSDRIPLESKPLPSLAMGRFCCCSSLR